MSPLDSLIRNLYAVSLEVDWRTARERALGLLVRHFGADGGAWLTTGGGSLGGAYSETAQSGFSKAGLLGLRFRDDEPLLPPTSSAFQVRALRLPHEGGRLVSVVALRWNDRKKPPPEPQLLAGAVAHMAEAAVLAMHQFVQRDEWLRDMGRPNRGAAALVDVRGVVHAGSDRFTELMTTLGGGSSNGERLSFPLPENMLDETGAFVRDGLHLRVEPMGGLYLVHARKPLPLDVLSPREQQIARALGAGKTFKSVARQCDIAVSTVANHATRIYRKLGVFRREELVELMRSSGIGPATGTGKLAA